LEPIIAGITASLLTLFDLDRTFYVPSKTPRKAALYAWWWGFVLANGVFAIAFYKIIGGIDALKDINPWLKAITVGVGYLAIIRLKFTTFNYQGKDVPFGLEAFYEALKGYVFRRINNIAKHARFTETLELANGKTLKDLMTQARLNIEQDQLLTADEKRSRKAWLLKVVDDATTEEADKRAVVADYILSGQRSSDIV
jgi:hypothetical protein